MADQPAANSRRTSSLLIIAGFLLFNLCYHATYFSSSKERVTVSIPFDASATLAKCRSLNVKPGPPTDFCSRNVSDRLVPGTRTVWIRNATVWTGRVQGLEVIHGDLLLEGGIIKHVGRVDESVVSAYEDLAEVDARGAWVTPGIIDVHSHLGIESTPAMRGADDVNSLKGLTLPWMRSLDGINTHDEGYASSISGGLTTALILPGSSNAIGGQAFVIKLRPTKERSPTSMLLEPPFSLNTSYTNHGEPLRWRHMKHACGENPSGTYSGTRMDTFWAFRKAYNTARTIKAAQDDYCEKALSGDWHAIAGKPFPEELQWEALVDVLRGRVKPPVQTHCYEAVDLDDFVRLSNEFQFPVAAFHHAHEAWLVPDVLKRAYEHPPAVAMFAAFSRYKREAFRHSEFAPRVLADNDIDVVMKSDHPAIVSRYLIHEAAQAHYYGLEENIALASVTTTAAKVLGLDHRIGYIKPGYDADIVIWDSHPLSLGATPKQVIIDGIPQLKAPHSVPKPASSQAAPRTPNFDKEAQQAVEYEGLPPLAPRSKFKTSTILFTNVSALWLRNAEAKQGVYDAMQHVNDGAGVAVVREGRVTCAGLHSNCALSHTGEYEIVDLRGGALQTGLVAGGAPLGLREIAMESSTTDGPVYNLLAGDPPSLVGGTGYLPHAADGLMFGTRDALLAYRSGVTVGVASPIRGSFSPGLSVAFSLGAAHKLEKGAVIQDVAALHVSIAHGNEHSVSTGIAALRRLLVHPPHDDDGWYKKVSEGAIPLVVETHSADIIATLILLKREVEAETRKTLRVTVLGGAEAHLLAAELAEAGVGVLLTPPRPLAFTWDYRRALPGLPTTNQSAVAKLVEAGVTVGIGPQGTTGMTFLSAWAIRNLRFDAGWELLNAPHTLTKADAYALVSSNVETLLGLPSDPYDNDLVATSGGDLLSYEGKVVAVISPRRGKVDFFE